MMAENGWIQCFHRLTIAAMAATLRNLRVILAKAEEHARQHRVDLTSLLTANLYADMFNLQQQLQYACFLPVDFAQHFSSGPPPRVGYDEATLPEFFASIDSTIAYLEAVTPERLAAPERTVPVFFDAKQGMAAEDYAASVIMPDFYFHVTVAYAILRHKGVPLGKSDFLGELQSVPIA